jgi:hypothetical protein
MIVQVSKFRRGSGENPEQVSKLHYKQITKLLFVSIRSSIASNKRILLSTKTHIREHTPKPHITPLILIF